MPDSSPSPRDQSSTSLPHGQGARLLERIGNGDESALEILYRSDGDRLFSMARHWLGDDHAASEALQDCFLRIWKKARQYDPARSNPSTWAGMILRGICLDQLRKKSRRPLLIIDSENYLASAGSPAVPFDGSIQEIRAAFSSLTPDERTVLDAALFDPATNRQLAERWQIPLATAKTRIHRAMLRLRELLR